MGIRMTPDKRHFMERIENFYVAGFSSGVVQLLRDGILGERLTYATLIGFWVLMSILVLAYLYFNGDSSQEYVHTLSCNHSGRQHSGKCKPLPTISGTL